MIFHFQWLWHPCLCMDLGPVLGHSWCRRRDLKRLPFSYLVGFSILCSCSRGQVLCFFSLLFRSVFENVHLSLVSQCGTLFFFSFWELRSSVDLYKSITGVSISCPFILDACLVNKTEYFILFLKNIFLSQWQTLCRWLCQHVLLSVIKDVLRCKTLSKMCCRFKFLLVCTTWTSSNLLFECGN